eukprot:scaffold300_cov258-Pinguiococcus_pyrenoidosus.AAC.14
MAGNQPKRRTLKFIYRQFEDTNGTPRKSRGGSAVLWVPSTPGSMKINVRGSSGSHRLRSAAAHFPSQSGTASRTSRDSGTSARCICIAKAQSVRCVPVREVSAAAQVRACKRPSAQTKILRSAQRVA